MWQGRAMNKTRPKLSAAIIVKLKLLGSAFKKKVRASCWGLGEVLLLSGCMQGHLHADVHVKGLPHLFLQCGEQSSAGNLLHGRVWQHCICMQFLVSVGTNDTVLMCQRLSRHSNWLTGPAFVAQGGKGPPTPGEKATREAKEAPAAAGVGDSVANAGSRPLSSEPS